MPSLREESMSFGNTARNCDILRTAVSEESLPHLDVCEEHWQARPTVDSIRGKMTYCKNSYHPKWKNVLENEDKIASAQTLRHCCCCLVKLLTRKREDDSVANVRRASYFGTPPTPFFLTPRSRSSRSTSSACRLVDDGSYCLLHSFSIQVPPADAK